MSNTSACQLSWENAWSATRHKLPFRDMSRACVQCQRKLLLPDWQPGMSFSCSVTANLFIPTPSPRSLAIHLDSPLSFASWKTDTDVTHMSDVGACHHGQMEHKLNCLPGKGRGSEACFPRSRAGCRHPEVQLKSPPVTCCWKASLIIYEQTTTQDCKSYGGVG